MMENTRLIKKINVRNIEKIYSDSDIPPLRIPDYQRAYSWTADELNDYINDLLNLKTSRVANQQRVHFMGGIVAYEEELESNFPQKLHYIVDGQQRLITFHLTLALIRAEYKTLLTKFEKSQNTQYTQRAKNKLVEIENYFQFKFTGTLGDEHRVDVLEASEMDQAIFQKVIAGEDTKEDVKSESHRRLRSARNKLRKELIGTLKNAAVDNEKLFEELGVLLDCIKSDCSVIYIVCPNLNDAYELFQVLNDRGKSLNDGDLLRAYTFKKAHEFLKGGEYDDQLTSYWNEILGSSDSQVKHFLEQYFRIETGSKAEKRYLYRQYQEKIFDLDQKEMKPDQAESIVSGKSRSLKVRDRVAKIRNYHRLFMELLEGAWPYVNEHQGIEMYDKYRLQLLVRVLDLKNLSIFMAAGAQLEQIEFRNILYIVEKFFFRYRTICEGSADSVGDVLGRHAHRIMTNKYNSDVFKQDLRVLIARDASDEVFSQRLRSTLIYKDTKIKQHIRYFLIFLEDHRKLYQNGIKPGDKKIDKSIINVVQQSSSVEHIFPQTPLESSTNPSIVNHESRGDLTNSIGNLTFMGIHDNSSLGNKSYQEKRPEYAKSKVWLNQNLADTYEEWDANSILARENWLIEQALKIFVV